MSARIGWRKALMMSALLWSGAAFALPVIPGATGFGIDTPAGRGGKVIRVTNLEESGTGSLRACVEASGPRVCVFDVSGTILMTRNLRISNPNITIAGQTAPAPGITLRGAALIVRTSDVLIQHIATRIGDAEEGFDPDNRDALYIEGTSSTGVIRNIVVANCSFSWSIDEVISVWQYFDNVTLINNIISEPLHDSIHPKTAPPGDGRGHGYGVSLGPHPGRISLIGNLFAHNFERLPSSRAGQLVFVNNVVYNGVNRVVSLSNRSGLATQNSVVGNVFIDGPDSRSTIRGRRIRLNDLVSGTKLYARDNFAPEATSDPWSIVNNLSDLDRAEIEAMSAPTWPDGLSTVSSQRDGVVAWVLSRAGSRPAERDVVDARIVNEVRSGTGGFVNCVEPDGTDRCSRNGGGWPRLAENRRQLELPASPSSDDNGNGYTNLEQFLHEMAWAVEGADSATTPKPPSPIDVK
jgi:hypothetical protein